MSTRDDGQNLKCLFCEKNELLCIILLGQSKCIVSGVWISQIEFVFLKFLRNTIFKTKSTLLLQYPITTQKGKSIYFREIQSWNFVLKDCKFRKYLIILSNPDCWSAMLALANMAKANSFTVYFLSHWSLPRRLQFMAGIWRRGMVRIASNSCLWNIVLSSLLTNTNSLLYSPEPHILLFRRPLPKD